MWTVDTQIIQVWSQNVFGLTNKATQEVDPRHAPNFHTCSKPSVGPWAVTTEHLVEEALSSGQRRMSSDFGLWEGS